MTKKWIHFPKRPHRQELLMWKMVSAKAKLHRLFSGKSSKLRSAQIRWYFSFLNLLTANSLSIIAVTLIVQCMWYKYQLLIKHIIVFLSNVWRQSCSGFPCWPLPAAGTPCPPSHSSQKASSLTLALESLFPKSPAWKKENKEHLSQYAWLSLC